MAYTEWTFQGRVLSWIRDFIRDKNLPFDGADQEIIVEDRKRPDILVWKDRKAREAALLLSLKGPYHDAWEAADDALSASWRSGTRYFATWNVNRFFMWDRYKRGNLYDQLVDATEVTTIKQWKEIDRVEESIKSFLKDFLIEFAEVYFEEKPLPPLPPDERFIYRLRSAIDALSIPAFYEIKNQWRISSDFKERLRKWFADQGWTFTADDEDFEKVARQHVYLLVNKIIFYYILRLKNSQLPKIQVPLGVDGEQFREILQSFFDKALQIDFETIFAADFLDTISLPDDLTSLLRNFIDRVGEYDFSKVGYEVIGRVFERLIPERERHKLGQYFTRSDVVDLIVGFCVSNPDAIVLDPACGAGTFPVRSYLRKKTLCPSKLHKELMKEIYAVDITKFPAHLTTINLAARDLSEEENYPRVLCKDFFDVEQRKRIPILKKEYVDRYQIEGLNIDKMMVEIPLCDAVVMNPPYTRQEEMESLVFPEGYRAQLQELVKDEWKGFYLTKMASIYAHFFFHGAKFLKKGGKIGLITSNSWLDVDYGKYLQKFFLKNFKIVTIIESKVERWFEDADINTCITILERCDEEKTRNATTAKFVQLKKPLTDLVPMTMDENERWKAVDNLIELIEQTNEYFENDKIRIFPKSQRELWDEGFNKDKGKYEGAKWGKYLRAQDIFFKILDRGKDKLVLLKEIADIKPGCYSGVNDFFYLDSSRLEEWKLKKRFLKPLIRTSRQVSKLYVDINKIDTKVFSCHLSKNEMIRRKFTGALKYIEWGEKQRTRKRQKVSAGIPWPETETVRRRKPGWWAIPESNLEETQLFMLYVINDRFICPFSSAPIVSDRCLHRIFPFDEKDSKVLWALLNSTLTALMVEVHGRGTLGQGALKFETMDAKRLLIADPRKLNKDIKKRLSVAIKTLASRGIKNVFDEVNLKDRQELDKIVMCEILELTQAEQEETYKAVTDLVRTRIERARSVVKRKKKIKGMDVDALVVDIFEEVGKGRLLKFPDDYIEGLECNEIVVPEGEAEVGQDLYGFYVKINGKQIRCKSPYEARYIQYAVLNGKTTVKIFKDKKLIREAVRNYGSLVREVKKQINDYLESTIPDRKLRERIKDDFWKKLTRQK